MTSSEPADDSYRVDPTPDVQHCLLVERVRHVIRGEIAWGNPTLEIVAARMGLQPRTLTRRLAKAGARHQELLDAERYALASAWLRIPGQRTIDVARALGYSTPSAFARAFRRWSGMSPQEYRERVVRGVVESNPR